MKYLILFFLTFSVFAETEIIIKRKSDGKLIAGDRGPNVTLFSVQQKMQRRGHNMDMSLYDVQTIDRSSQKKDFETSTKGMIQAKKQKVLDRMIIEYMRARGLKPGDL